MAASRKAGVLLVALMLASFLMSSNARAERLPIKSYTIADGLARDQINRIVRDSRGFLWFCTPDGLSRFDGYRFINYGTDQGLPSRAVNDLLETRSGDYWIATRGGLARFNPYPTVSSTSQRGNTSSKTAFLAYHLEGEASAPTAYALCEDHAGTVWCGTEASLYRIDEVDGHWISSIVDLGPPTRFGSANAYAILEDHRGALWVATGTGIYRRKPDGTVERFDAQQGIPLADHKTLLEDREGTIWLGTGSGVYRLVSQPETNRSVVARVYTTRDGLGGNFVTSLFQSSDGRVWVGTDNALNEFVPAANQDGRFRTYTSANGASAAMSIGEDGDGNLWIGTETHGAMKIAANGFKSYGLADGLGENRIGQISEDRAGNLYVLSGAFVHRFDGRGFTAVHFALPSGITRGSWGWYQHTLQDHTGEWWRSTEQGLVRYPRSSSLEQLAHSIPKAVYSTRNGLGGNQIFRIFEDSHGDIWAGTIDVADYTLGRWDRRTGTCHRYSSREEGIPSSAPTAFCEDPAGSLWIGFYGGGVARHRDGRFTPFTKEDGLPAGFISEIYLDRAGRLWIATGEGGVVRVDDPGADHPHFVAYTTADGLSSNQATCITEDQWGRIYVGTGRGVDRLDTETGRIKRYTTADGLASNFVNVSFRDREGALWFGTLDGLSRFIPEAEQTEPPPPILIGALRIAGVQQTISELGETYVSGIKLGANQNQLELEFFGLSFAPGESLRYQYKLEGAHQDWSPLAAQRIVSYPNLGSGAYRFLVRAVSADGVASLSPATIEFTILPPIWARGWFIALTAILASAMAYSLYRYRVARLIEVERMRTRIASDLHDDIGSGLSQVSVLSEVIRRRAGIDSRVSEPLGMIAGLSRDLVDSMNDIVWAINPNRDHLSDLTQRMRRFASDVFTARDIEFNFAGPDSQHNIRLGADLRREIFLIFKESVNNMVRHSGCNEASIDFIIEGGWLELKLGDNGRGFDPDREGDGNGLLSMRQRAERIGGKLDIASTSSEGTTVRLRAPIGRQRWIRR